jgi:hypothetical protein
MEKIKSLFALAKSKVPSLATIRAKLPETPEPLKNANKSFQIWKQRYFPYQNQQDKQPS